MRRLQFIHNLYTFKIPFMKTNVLFPLLMLLSTTATRAATGTSVKAIILDFYQAFDAGDLEKAGSFLAEDVQVSIPFVPGLLNKQAFKELGNNFRLSFPDMQHQVLEVTEGKNSAGFIANFSGTNTGMIQGNPPTGNRVAQDFLGYWTFNAEGKVASIRIQFDLSDFYAQLMKGTPQPQDALKSMAHQLMRSLSAKDLDSVLANFTPDAIFTGWQPVPTDREGYRQTMSGLLAAFPDAQFTVDDILTDGDKVMVRHHLEGTHTGAPFQQVPVSNRKVFVNAVVTYQLRDGKIVQAWLNADFLGMMMQLGAFPGN